MREMVIISGTTIRPYTKADKKACTELFKGNLHTLFDPSELEEFEEWLTNLEYPLVIDGIASENYYVAEKEGRLIACGGFYLYPDTSRAELAWGMVEFSLQRKGLGRELVDHCVQLITSRCPDALISLYTSKFSYPFFEKCGFKLTRVTKGYYALNEDRYDMELTVKQPHPVLSR